MDIQFLNNNLSLPTILIPAIIKAWKPYYEAKAFQEYEPEGHKVMNPVERKDKIVAEPIPGAVADAAGNIPTQTTTKKVTRIALALQKEITETAAAFLTGGGCTLKAKDLPEGDNPGRKIYNAVSTTWDNNKLDFENGPMAEAVLSQLETAEIWHRVKDAQGKVKMKVRFCSPADGYELMPVFDNRGDLIAFGVKCAGRDAEGKEAQFMDLYTKEYLHRYISKGGEWQLNLDIVDEDGKTAPNPITLPYGKIPVIYNTVPKAVWQDVQTSIEQVEELVSNYGDTNKYNGNPILYYRQTDNDDPIVSMPSKDDMGKSAQGVGDLKYVSIDSQPNMVIFEYNTHMAIISRLTKTPDLSFEAMKGLGDISGAALERLLIGAHLKAIKGHTGWYGKGIQRRINFLKSACASIEQIDLAIADDLTIIPQFSLFRINGESERIETALKANGGRPVMSHLESIQFAGTSDDPNKSLEDIEEQSQQDVDAGGDDRAVKQPEMAG